MARYHLHKHDQCNCVLDAFSSFVYANYNRFDVVIRNRKCSKLTLLGITDAFNWDGIVIAKLAKKIIFLWNLIDTTLALIRINTVNYLQYGTV